MLSLASRPVLAGPSSCIFAGSEETKSCSLHPVERTHNRDDEPGDGGDELGQESSGMPAARYVTTWESLNMWGEVQ